MIELPPNGSSRDYSQPQYLFWWGLLILILGGLLGAAAMRGKMTRPTATDTPLSHNPARELPVLGSISDFELTERSGKTVTRADLQDSVTIVDFIFTYCGGICPIMTSQMKTLQDHFDARTPIRFLSISVDPERDTPKALSSFAKRYDADPERWWFLTGDTYVIYRLCRESFMLTVERVGEDKLEADMEPVMHSPKFVLLDRDVRIRGYYDGTIPEEVDQLKRDVVKLLD